MIAFKCKACKARIEVPPDYAGRTGTCNQCGGAITVPNPWRKAGPVALLFGICALPLSCIPLLGSAAMPLALAGLSLAALALYHRARTGSSITALVLNIPALLAGGFWIYLATSWTTVAMDFSSSFRFANWFSTACSWVLGWFT